MRPFAAVARAASVALAAIGVVLAGGLFLVLLPICGVASIAEGVLHLCWDAVRGARDTARRRGAPSHH